MSLAGSEPQRMLLCMFVVSETEAAAVELRRLFPGITDTAQARSFARTIAGWTPLPVAPRSARRVRPGRAR
jgi:hypothetical protein